MLETQTWEIFLLVVAVFSSIIVFYFTSRKKIKKPYYKSSENWKEHNPHHSDELVFSVFLIGDAGAIDADKSEPHMDILKDQLQESGERSAIFFLGDNIYPRGMPEPDSPLHAMAEERLLSQLNVVKDYPGRVCFISGNHDWNKGRKGGYKAVMRQQAYIDAYFAREDVFLPRNGCPGPHVMELSDDVVALVINTQWWVHSGLRPIGAAQGCVVEDEEDFFSQLKDLLDLHHNKHIIVIGHHPMYSKAFHGGKFDVKQHIFPFTDLHKKMYIPVPLAGSLYPMYRKYIGAKEDISHPRYKRMRNRLVKIFTHYEDLIYAAGHDHNLQYLKRGKQHYIISGAGSKVTFVHKGKDAMFTHAHKGFFRVNYYSNGLIWIEAWEPDENNPKGKLAYRKKICRKDE